MVGCGKIGLGVGVGWCWVVSFGRVWQCEGGGDMERENRMDGKVRVFALRMCDVSLSVV